MQCLSMNEDMVAPLGPLIRIGMHSLIGSGTRRLGSATLPPPPPDQRVVIRRELSMVPKRTMIRSSRASRSKIRPTSPPLQHYIDLTTT